MTNLRPEICIKIRDARRAAGISQSVLAKEVGCGQSALSMFEQGAGTKLNDEVIGKLAKKFGIELREEEAGGSTSEAGLPVRRTEAGRAFCPNPDCPSNARYEVSGRVFARPDRAAADPVGGRFCAVCGEVLERACPSCGAPVHEGAVCSFCGSPYVTIAEEL